MCKKNELLGTAIMACGAGMLLSLLFSSQLDVGLIGLGLITCGLCCARRP